ncbi:MAG: hypothetical protein JWP29_3461 [Rhodoferax sp.]|nr:hypothetical protein [Rhodoferax sp.]
MTAAATAEMGGAAVDCDWAGVQASLDARGYAVLPGLLAAPACHTLVARYDDAHRYRSRVVMARHGFGSGEYQYFNYPLPESLQTLRTALYPRLVPIANRWAGLMRANTCYPPTLDAFLERCHAAGQTRPTPLILKYGVGDYNCLHQDLYGEQVFPLQVAALLSNPGEDFSGGEFVMTETGSAEQLAHVVPLRQGDAVVFTVNQRPVKGVRASRRVAMRHGVSRVRTGHRYTVGLIFHDAL